MARTGAPGPRGISAFVVEQAPPAPARTPYSAGRRGCVARSRHPAQHALHVHGALTRKQRACVSL